ncbi:MAG: A/G-specific adenine glycosylase [Elusimicrobia bacterium]|nr:A/G-specific adenine glycosylase [Elusimicrobiota bacterium]
MKPSARAALLRWYRRQRRDLPWRRDPTPYRVWVSEIMLQQTTVAAVAPRYERFLSRFPDEAALADAPQQDVLKEWSGLGYYARARNLHRAAAEIVRRHGGRFPGEPETVRALPGVGRYTAGAILSIAFGKREPLVDGNVIRIFARYYGLAGSAKDAALQRECWSRAEKLVPKESPGDWNQALMELGATLCAPDAPSCAICPLSRDCTAFRGGDPEQFPAPAQRRSPVPVRWTCLWIEHKGRVLLWKRSEKERLLKNLWGLPESQRVPAAPGRKTATISHTITHHDVEIALREGSLRKDASLPPEASWVPKSKLRDYLVSSLWLKCLRASAAQKR